MAIIEAKTILLRGGDPCTIRSAEEADAAAMLEHIEHSTRNDPFTVRLPGEATRTLEEMPPWIRGHREQPGQLLIVAVLERPTDDPAGGIAGALRFACGDRQRVAHHGHFGLAAHADWRGRGVGSTLITTLLDWAAAHPVLEKICLGVLEPNAGARRLYDRLGFVQESRSARHFKFGPGNYVDDIQMAIYVKEDVAPEGFKTWRHASG